MFIPIEFQKVFQKTQQSAIAVKAKFTDNPTVTASRFGGEPYWEKDVELPKDAQGKTLALLAQINFSELPQNNQLPDEGILQLFIPRDDDYYGANLDEVGGGSQMVSHYWEKPDVSKATELSDHSDSEDLVPVFGAHVLSFTEKQDIAGIDTIECAEKMGANPFEMLEDVALNEKEENLFFDAITKYVAGHGHKILGYPSFINGDPRADSDYHLLLQIDTDMADDNDIMWGDDGVGQIFIREADLAARRFDKLWLFWDC